MNLLLNQLPRILFEAFFVLMIAGCILAVMRNFRRRSVQFYFLAASLIFMLAWRVSIETLSKRYSAVLIYAGVCFSVYFIYSVLPYLALCFRRFFRKEAAFVLRRYSRLARRVILLVLVLLCIGKLSRFNRYDNALPEMCRAVTADASGYSRIVILELCGEADRLEYYLEKPVIPMDEQLKPESAAVNKRIAALLAGKEYDAVYVLCKEKKGVASGSALIFSMPNSNRKKLYLNAYRYTGEKDEQ